MSEALHDYAKQIGLLEAGDTVTIKEAFPGYAENPLGMALRVVLPPNPDP